MAEVYKGYLIMAGPNDDGYIVRFPAIDPVTQSLGTIAYHDVTRQLCRNWVDTQVP